MPTPIDILLDPLSLIVLGIYAVLISWEALFPARKLPYVKYWKLKGMTFFVLFFYLSSYLPMFIDPYLSPYQLVDLSGLGIFWGATIGILLYEFALYIWHRLMHTSDFLWRVFHQMHHSAERTDAYGAYFFSPFDMIGFTVMSSVCFTLLIGLSPEAITIVLLTTTFLAIFQHANIRTPQWLGYLVQRPESHAYHHARGIHRHNYSDLPIFDILFGTFVNPKVYEHEAGFYHGASERITDMLIFRDVTDSQSSGNGQVQPGVSVASTRHQQ